MALAETETPSAQAGKVSLRACWALFAIYFANVFIGKANIAYHLGWPQLGNVAEFLLLSAASTLLIVAALKRETAEKRTLNQQPTEESP